MTTGGFHFGLAAKGGDAGQRVTCTVTAYRSKALVAVTRRTFTRR